VVKDDLGVNRLEDKHFLKSARSKKKVSVTLEEGGETEDDGEEEEDDDTSDEATQAYQKPAEEDKEEAEGIDNAFLPAGWRKRGFKNKEEKKAEEKPKVCIHHRKGRCNFGLSGKMKVDGEWKKCPFAHPRVCEKLLSNGDRGRFGCKGDCKKLHPKMCYSSLNTKKCPHDKTQCRNGYHVRGTEKTENAGKKKNESAFPRAGRVEKTGPAFPQAGVPKQNEPFFDLGQRVREEILGVLKELKLTAPPPPPEPKIVSKEELKEALMALLA
jgi:hypothetical protein